MPSEAEGKTLLIVEDEEEVRTLLAMVFETEGFTVLQAEDGQEGLEVFTERQEEIGAVVTDLGLPRLGGVEMIGMIRALSPSVKIIGASGYGRENVGEKVLAAGGNLFVPKPFVAAELVRHVKSLMGEK